jgi:hypothetical protein
MKGVKVKKDFTKDLIQTMRGMSAQRVLVGIPQEKDPRKGDPIGNAALAYIHENGSPAQNIPARPFLVPGAKEASEKAPAILKASAIEALSGFDPKKLDQGLNRVGLHAQSVVKQRIQNQVGFEPLKKGTLSARKRKGFQGEKALIRTGEMMNSIKYVIR